MIEYFALGFSSRGAMKNRVAIPLHNPEGVLIGYAGRITDDALISESCPKYKFPSTRERKGKLLEFRKSMFLYNAHRLKNPPAWARAWSSSTRASSSPICMASRF